LIQLASLVVGLVLFVTDIRRQDDDPLGASALPANIGAALT
jgi:hypothetical protein